MPRFATLYRCGHRSIYRFFFLLMCGAAALSIFTACGHKGASSRATFSGEGFEVFKDSITDGECFAHIIGDSLIESNFPDGKNTIRKRILSASKYGVAYHSKRPIMDAVVSMSLSDLDSVQGLGTTLRTAMAVELALAYVDPERAKNELRSRISSGGEISQGASYGGGWPVTSDAIAWASAAWSVYEATGDRAWLREAFNAITTTLNKYERVVYNSAEGLFTGSSTYCGYLGALPFPYWMDMADVSATMNLTVNACVARAYTVAAKMAERIGIDGSAYRNRADSVADAINSSLWIPNLSMYSQYLYCQPYPIQSATTDNLGQALCMVYGIASDDMRKAILENTPVLALGIPAMYPQLSDPNAKPNPSSAIIPAVQAYWAIAASEDSHVSMLYRCVYAIARSAAMNLGNYPFVDSATGKVPSGIVSTHNDPLSACAAIGALFRGLCGLQFTEEGMEINPKIADTHDDYHSIQGLKYRDAELDIHIHGTGSSISSFRIDSMEQSSHRVPHDLQGPHTVDIIMGGSAPKPRNINNTPDGMMPQTVTTLWKGLSGRIVPFTKGLAYEVYINGTMQEQVFTNRYRMVMPSQLMSLSMVPVREEQYIGYASRPAFFMPDGWITEIPSDSLAWPGTELIPDRTLASSFVETTESYRSKMTVTLNVAHTGEYMLRSVYSNALADASAYSDFCAIRLIEVNDSIVGTMIMPPVKKDDWTTTAQSNLVRFPLKKGINKISVVYRRPWTVNGHITLNTALIKQLQLYRIQ